MSQSIRISSGFGLTLQHIPNNNTCIFRTKHTCMDVNFPIISLSAEKCRKRAWISSVSNHNPLPPFLLSATLGEEDGTYEEDITTSSKGKKGGVIPTFFQGLWDRVCSHFSLKPETKPPTSFELSKEMNTSLMKSMEQAMLLIWEFLQGIMRKIKNRTGMKKRTELTGSDILTETYMLTGWDMLLKEKSVVRITTGSQAVDELLGGGIQTMAITEAFGESRSGKTQLAHTLCITTQLPTNTERGNSKVAFVDTQRTSLDRVLIVAIAERFGMDAEVVMDNIGYYRAYTYEEQYNLLLGLAAKMSEEPIRLLIVDSVVALLQGEAVERGKKLDQMLSLLKKITRMFNVAVFITNEVITGPGEGVIKHSVARAAKIRLMIAKGKGEQQHVCKVFHNPNLREGEAIFQITPGGIADAKD